VFSVKLSLNALFPVSVSIVHRSCTQTRSGSSTIVSTFVQLGAIFQTRIEDQRTFEILVYFAIASRKAVPANRRLTMGGR
jgi:hypothetical protein